MRRWEGKFHEVIFFRLIVQLNSPTLTVSAITIRLIFSALPTTLYVLAGLPYRGYKVTFVWVLLIRP